MKTIEEYLNREFLKEELVVIGELIKMAELMTDEEGVPHSDMHQALGAIFLERAASIIRQEVKLFVPDVDYIREFSRFWNVEKRAKFNVLESK